jgi:hypothetical protein
VQSTRYQFLDFRAGLATYRLSLCHWTLRWPSVAGIYGFISVPSNVPIYLGETTSFASRMPFHEVWAEAQGYGATDVYAMVHDGPEWQRKAVERALIAAYNPICNTQHRTTGLGIAGLSRFGSFGSGIFG